MYMQSRKLSRSYSYNIIPMSGNAPTIYWKFGMMDPGLIGLAATAVPCTATIAAADFVERNHPYLIH